MAAEGGVNNVQWVQYPNVALNCCPSLQDCDWLAGLSVNVLRRNKGHGTLT